MSHADALRVAIRVRPLIERETRELKSVIAHSVQDKLQIAPGHAWISSEGCIQQVREINKNGVPAAIVHASPPPKDHSANTATTTWYFDHVFGHESTNEQVFSTLAVPMVDALLEGFNCTIFAYGQTSSGKTHTMFGSDKDPGLVPRMVRSIFDKVAASPEREFLLRVSYLELYNEVLNDLMQGGTGDLKIREDAAKGHIYVEGVKEDIVHEAEQVERLIAGGFSRRHIGSTSMNKESSRSHALFKMVIESAPRGSSDECVLVSTLNLVDLAGSERLSQTQATGTRLNEGININKSLLALGTVINKLSEGRGAVSHVPFRDSKLTRLLQSSLGGNSKTLVLCNITPSITAVEESISTLRFASRAKLVVNTATKNEVVSEETMIRRMHHEIESLRKELESRRRTMSSGSELEAIKERAQQAELSKAELEQKLQYSAREQEEMERKLRNLQVSMLNSAKKKRRTADEFALQIARHWRLKAKKSSIVRTLQDTDLKVQRVTNEAKREIEMLKSRLGIANERAALVDTLTEERDELQRLYGAQQLYMKSLNESVFDANREQQEASSKLKKALGELKNFAIEKSEMTKTATKQSLELETVTGERERMRENLYIARTDVERVTGERDAAWARAVAAEAATATANDEIARLRAQIAQLTADLEAMRVRALAAEAQVTRGEDVIAALDAKLQAETAARAQAVTDRDATRAQLADVSVQLADTRSQLQTTMDQYAVCMADSQQFDLLVEEHCSRLVSVVAAADAAANAAILHADLQAHEQQVHVAELAARLAEAKSAQLEMQLAHEREVHTQRDAAAEVVGVRDNLALQLVDAAVAHQNAVADYDALVQGLETRGAELQTKLSVQEAASAARDQEHFASMAQMQVQIAELNAQLAAERIQATASAQAAALQIAELQSSHREMLREQAATRIVQRWWRRVQLRKQARVSRKLMVIQRREAANAASEAGALLFSQSLTQLDTIFRHIRHFFLDKPSTAYRKYKQQRRAEGNPVPNDRGFEALMAPRVTPKLVRRNTVGGSTKDRFASARKSRYNAAASSAPSSSDEAS